MTAPTEQEEAILASLGFRRRFRLAGHPAYPDPLDIWPPSVENATDHYRRYCTQTFEEYVAALGYTPRRFGGGPMTAADFNPRVLVVWEHVGPKTIFTPAAETADA